MVDKHLTHSHRILSTSSRELLSQRKTAAGMQIRYIEALRFRSNLQCGFNFQGNDVPYRLWINTLQKAENGDRHFIMTGNSEVGWRAAIP
jgi:hypothetical protein